MYPLRHGMRRASSPKGDAFALLRKLYLHHESRPLGEGGIAVGDDGRGNSRANPL